MRTRSSRGPAAAATMLVVVAWLVALVPTGLALHDLASFAALGTILWTAYAATAHVFARRDWPWRSALRSALLGASILPPLIAVLVAVAGIERPQQLLMLFVYGAWITVGAGAITGAMTRPGRERRRGLVRRSAAAVRERVLQRKVVRRFLRGAPEPVLVPDSSGAVAPPTLNRAPDGTPALPPR